MFVWKTILIRSGKFGRITKLYMFDVFLKMFTDKIVVTCYVDLIL